MKTLFLTASFADVASHFPAFIGEALAGKSVAFIPTACDVEDITFFMDDDRNAFKKLGIRIDELDLAAMSPATLTQKSRLRLHLRRRRQHLLSIAGTQAHRLG